MKQLILLHALVALHLGQFALPADAQVLPLNEDLTISQDGGEYLLSWFGRDNYLYTLETSETLKDWYALPYLEAGFGETLASSISTNADRLFLRVRGTERPELTAEASPRIVCVGETVTFTATAGTEGGFSWSGAVSGDSDIVQAQFSTPGLKEATVTYTINGIGISETVTVEVREIELTASASPATACAGEEIVFSAWASGCSGDYDWTGDASGNEAINSQVFDEAGTYQAVVRFSRGGTELFETVTVVITEPEIVVTAHPAVVHPGETVTLSAYLACGAGDFVEWTGDATGTNAVMEMNFAAPGVHTATAEFVIEGKSYTEDATVTVKPTVEVSASADEVYPGETITFTAFGQNPSGGSHQWSGDVSGTGKTKPITAKANRDSYTGIVVYKRNGLESRPVSATVKVKRPTVTASASSSVVARGEDVTFSAEVSGGVSTGLLWSGAVEGYGPSRTRSFSSPGVYKAAVTYSMDGVTFRDAVFVTVKPDEPEPLQCEDREDNGGYVYFSSTGDLQNKVTLLVPLSDPLDPQWVYVPVVGSIVTFCTPEARDLWGDFRLKPKNSSSDPGGSFDFTLDGEEILMPHLGSNGTGIRKTFPGHSGGGVHDWHGGAFSLGILQTLSPVPGVVKLSIRPIRDPTPGATTVPEDSGQVEESLELTIMTCHINGLREGEILAHGEERLVSVPCVDEVLQGGIYPPLEDAEVHWHEDNVAIDQHHLDPSHARVIFLEPGEDQQVAATIEGPYEGQQTFLSPKVHVARVALDAIPVGQTEPLPEEEKNDPGAWILARRDAQSPEPAAKATLIVRPTEVSSLTRRLTWNNNLLIVRNKATGALVSSGVTLSEDEEPVEFTVAGTENFAAGGEATVTLTVRKPNNATLGTDKVKFIRPNVSVTWESRHGPGLLEEFSVSEYDNEFTALDLEWLNGWRYFPCAEEPGGPIRNIVDVKVNMPGYGGKTVHLRAFDVDDATPLEFDPGGTIDEYQGRGNDNSYLDHEEAVAGRFIENHSRSIVLELDTNGEAMTQFRVGTRPGANYRIAAVLDGFQNRLTALQVDNDANPDYVPNVDAQLNDIIPGGISPALTIWRKLHLEVDSMDAVPEEGPEKNVYTGTIIKTLPSPRLGPPRTIVQVSSAPGVRDRFQAGRLAVGSDTYFVHGSKPAENRKYKDVFYPAPAEVEGVVPSSVDGTAYTLRDDDDLHRDEIGLHPSLPYDQHSEEIVEAIRPKFPLLSWRLSTRTPWG